MPGLALDQNNKMTPIKSADFKKRGEAIAKNLDLAFGGAKDNDARKEAAEAVSEDVLAAGVNAAFAELNLAEKVMAALNEGGKKSANKRAGALEVVEALAVTCKAAAEPYLLPFVVPALGLMGDKARFVQNQAKATVEAISKLANANATKDLVTQLLKKVHSEASNAQRLNLITLLAKANPDQMGRSLSDAIPAVCGDLHDLKKSVSAAARSCLMDLCGVCKNTDIVPLLPVMASAMDKHDEIPECVYKLASTTFVQDVDAATLAVLSPILVRGFAERLEKIKRACARIVENMSKLVEDPRDLAPFLPTLLPLMESAMNSVADPEVRGVIDQAILVLKAKSDISQSGGMAAEKVQPTIEELFQKHVGHAVPEYASLYIKHVSTLVIAMNDARAFEEDWQASLKPYLTPVIPADMAEKIIAETLDIMSKAAEDIVEEEELDAEKLCDCEFSLAYGNKVLLKKTRIRLHRGYMYGLIGKNDSGKTSLMRAIAEYRVDGFPSKDELKTMFVETDIPADDADFTVVDYIFQHPSLKELQLDRDEVIKTLDSVGFNDNSPAKQTSTVGELSGGWRMKIALARAMLLNADILLLDEPTNHLDAYNVKWVEDWLTSLKGVTAIMVSHDSGLLDRVCNNMIQIENLKLHHHKGNLSAFVAKRPDCKSYFELKSDKYKFTFPQPGRLEGITSKGKAILKMSDITFTYPSATKPQLNNVSVQVCLASRVACVGVNGAGKSTMIKLLTGELEPDEGSGDVWKHPNCRVGYIAQHAFHHIEQHLEKTANEYICWRYEHGNDREELVKVTTKVNDEDIKNMQAPLPCSFMDPETGEPSMGMRKVKSLTESRRENKAMKDQEYEVQLADDKMKNTSLSFWVLRKALIKGGWEKVVKEIDDRIATRAAMFANPLTQENVKKHLGDVGLEAEFSTHMRMGALSGGQKVKVVLAAALWNRPHILILDEPTNYLDRDSLGALAAAIRVFEGGVVMITHNSQFCDDLCPEVWHLENNTLNRKGDAAWMHQQEKIEEVAGPETKLDKFGNTIKLAKVYTAKEQKKRDKLRKKINKQRKKDGMDPLDTDDDDF